jgi:hypothetical protein
MICWKIAAIPTPLDLLPTRFGDIFHIGIIFLHKRWHNDIIDSVDGVSNQIESVEDKLDRINFLLSNRQPAGRRNSNSSNAINISTLKHQMKLIWIPFFKFYLLKILTYFFIMNNLLFMWSHLLNTCEMKFMYCEL